MNSLYMELTFCLLRTIVKAAQEGDLEKLKDLGIEAKAADNVLRLRPSDIQKLSRVHKVVDFTINSTLLDDALNHSKWAVAKPERVEATATILRGLAELCADPDNHKSLKKDLELSTHHISAIGDMNIVDIYEMAKHAPIFYSLTVNSIKFNMALDYVLEDMRQEEILHRLVKADASLTMIQTLTGRGKAAFIELRKKFNLDTSKGGSPKRLSDNEMDEAWVIWRQYKELPIAERCLQIHTALDGVALRSIWPSVAEWMALEAQTKFAMS